MLRFVLLICLLSPLHSWGDLYPKGIAFQHVLENKDIALGTVFSTYQDREGFIWFGSENSLARYDGYNLKPIFFYEAVGGQERRKNLTILDIFEDRQGTLWLASSEGLLYYDRQRNRLLRAPAHPSLANTPISKAYLRKILDLNNGTFAVASYTGLYIINPKTGEGKKFTPSSEPKIQHDSVRSLHLGDDNTLWLGLGFGLDRIHLDTGTIEHFKPYANDLDSVPHNCVTSILKAENNALWLGTRRGILHFNPESLEYEQYLHNANEPSGASSPDVWTIFKGIGRAFWVGTERGLIQFDPDTNQAVTFHHEPGRLSSLSSNVIRDIFTDKDNNTWVSTFPSGVNYLDASNSNASIYTKAASDNNSLSHNSVLSVAEDANGDLWLGTDGGGLNFFDRSKNAFTHYFHDILKQNSISSDRILSVMIDSKNTLWGGTWGGGVFFMDLDTRQVSRLPGHREATLTPGVSRSNALKNDKVWSVIEDRQGYIWISTIRSGLSRFDPNTGEFLHYVNSAEDSESIPSNYVWTTFEDSYGRFWVGTTGGLSLLNRDTHKFENLALSSRTSPSAFHWPALAIFEDSKSRIWVGTDTGLFLFDPENYSFSTFGLEEGFIDESIRSIAEDANGHLWLGTNGGVTLFDPNTLAIKNYYRENGKLIDGFNYNSSLLSKTGEIVIGGKGGLRIFAAENTKTPKKQRSVVFTDFKIFNKSVAHGLPDSPLSAPISRAKSIHLKHDDSFFSFQFSALDFSNRDQSQYSYMLEGFDKQWNNIGFQRTATYTNLDPGKYELKVKSKTVDGLWGDEYTGIGITIRPPWWQSTWAYCAYLLIFVFAYLYYRHNRSLKDIIKNNNNSLELKQKLNQRVTKILEDERKSISQEVHDNINSTIVATRMIMQNIERISQNRELDKEKITYLAKKADAQLSETYDFFRSFLQKLRPEIIETLGFDGAMQELVEQYNRVSASHIFELEVIGKKIKVNDDIGIGLYRVAQEAITNAIKHASATKISVSLCYRLNTLEMTISDNGIGFIREATPGLGIEHMTDRIHSLNGSFNVTSSTGPYSKGTVVSVSVPISNSNG